MNSSNNVGRPATNERTKARIGEHGGREGAELSVEERTGGGAGGNWKRRIESCLYPYG